MIAPDKNPFYVIGDFKFINYVYLTKEQKIEVLNSRNQDIVREKMYKSDMISIKDHFQFIDRLLTLTDRSYWYIELDGEYVGSYNLTDYSEIDNSCESGVFFRYTDLKHLDLNIQMLRIAYDFSFNEMCIKLMRGNTKISNVFMVNLISYFGFSTEICANTDYVAAVMTKENYINNMRNRQVNMKEFIKYIKIKKS